MKTYDKQSKIRTLGGVMSIIAPAILCLTAGASFADNANLRPAQENSQETSAEKPQQIEAAKASVEASSVQPNESASNTAKSYPEETAFITSGEGLTEASSTVEDGGVLVDLEGRFRSPRTAVIGADGKVQLGHEPHDKITGKGKGGVK